MDPAQWAVPRAYPSRWWHLPKCETGPGMLKVAMMDDLSMMYDACFWNMYIHLFVLKNNNIFQDMYIYIYMISIYIYIICIRIPASLWHWFHGWVSSRSPWKICLVPGSPRSTWSSAFFGMPGPWARWGGFMGDDN